MASEVVFPDDGTIEVLPIHFDVPEHYIPLNTFIETARETEAIIQALNERWFRGELEYRIVVVPPKEGSFLAYLGITIATVGAATWAFLQSDPGKEFIRELTGHEFKDLMGLAGRKVRERVLKKPPVEKSKEVVDQSSQEEPAKLKDVFAEEQKLATSIVVIETTRKFLVTDVSELRRTGLTPETFQEGFEARNEFYRACADEKEIRAVGFDETDNFPIKRRDFARLQVSVEPREAQLVADIPTVEITSLTVSSPNWDRGDSKRQWRGKEPNGIWRNFQVSDESFWALASKDQLNLHGQDTMKVQWSYLGEGKQRKSFKVLKVLEYNGEELSEPLDENALDAILGPHALDSIGQTDLFAKK